jgi:seryl-tRNA synthetase
VLRCLYRGVFGSSDDQPRNTKIHSSRKAVRRDQPEKIYEVDLFTAGSQGSPGTRCCQQFKISTPLIHFASSLIVDRTTRRFSAVAALKLTSSHLRLTFGTSRSNHSNERKPYLQVVMPPRLRYPLRVRLPQLTRRVHVDAHVQPPPTAPKPSVNIKAIRAAPDYHIQNCLNRNYAPLSTYPTQIVELYDEWSNLQKALRSDRERHNAISMQLRKAAKEEKDELVKEAQALKSTIGSVEEKEKELERTMRQLASALPNETHPDTPIGTEPKLLGYINEHLAPGKIDPEKEVKSHVQIGSDLKLMDFADAGVVSGWGWYYLLNEGVMLEQALVNYALSLARSKGWSLVSPPNIVYTHMSAACGFQPRDHHGEQQSYLVNDGRHVLAGTAEIPLAGMNANKTLSMDDFPQKVVGVGRAYRAEAGARGVDSKGLYRVHEFTKVELFAWAPPAPEQKEAKDGEEDISASTSNAFTSAEGGQAQSAEDIFNEMLGLQKEFLTSLGLHARILEMPSTDLGASASRKIDIEAFMPSRAKKDPWGEVSSLSNCTDYQSRRLNTRLKLEGGSGKKTTFPYTLNGTACAVPRVMIAILENGWDEKREVVVIPEVLRPFMGGMEFIGRSDGKNYKHNPEEDI